MQRFTVILFFLLSAATQSYATHVFALKMSYQCLGNSQYEVTVHLYRDCSGVAAPSSVNINLRSVSCNVSNITHALAIDSSQSELQTTPLCPSVASQSSCNGGSLPGEDGAVYRGIITLPMECPDWVLSCSPQPRSSYFTNIVNPGSSNLYIEALIDNSFGACYDSPVFRNDPMLYACAGYLFAYDMGAFDWEADSLVYTLVAPKSSASTSVSFQSGLSPTQPLAIQGGTSFEFNNRNGRLSFVSQSGNVQFAAIAIVVEKYHGGKVVSSTMSELDIQSNTFCNNASIVQKNTQATYPPNTIYNDTLKAFISCNPFDSLAFSYEMYDLAQTGTINVSDTTDLDEQVGATNWQYNIQPQGTPSRPDSALVAVNMNLPSSTSFPSDTFRSFYIEMTDEACPFSSYHKAHFAAYRHFIKAAVSDDVLCANETKLLQLGASGLSPATNIQWTQVNNGAPTVALSNANILNPTLNVPALSGGTVLQYVIDATMASCQVSDTISIRIVDNPTINFQITDVSSAGAMDGSVMATVAGNLQVFSYDWQTGANVATINNLGVGDYTLTATDYYGCQSVDTATVSVGSAIHNLTTMITSMDVLPNPTQDKTIHLQLRSERNTEGQLLILDVLGQVVKEYPITIPRGTIQKDIPLQDLPTGIYTLHIRTAQQGLSKKVILH